jgi:two-component system response regulator YesN
VEVIEKAPNVREILDLGQLKKLLGYFSIVTGMDAAFFDLAGHELAASRRVGSICASAKNGSRCREYLSYGGRKAAELGEPYIFACGCGLIMCSSPIMFEEHLIGSIACGPAILWDADEVALSEFTEKTRNMGLRVDAAALFHSAPSCDCVNMTGAAQILFIIVNSLTREHSVYLDQRAQITEQQAKIAELIIERKNHAALISKENRLPDPVYPEDTERELINLVQSGSKEQARRVLTLLLSEIFSFADGNMDTIRIRLFELIAFFSRAAVETGAPLPEVNRIMESFFAVFDAGTDFESICFSTAQAMDGFIDTISRVRGGKALSPHLARALDYILAHYDRELTLGKVAESIFVSGFYLSHLFRKEMNQTFSDYVGKIRIDQAKLLLKKDKTLQIQEIAERAGFNDPNYFAKTFKKLTGVTPREYQSFFK